MVTSLAPSPQSTPPTDGPDWMREAIAVTVEEGRRFVATAIGFMRRPGTFSADWLAGRQRALNPLGFVATALGISGLANALLPNDSEGFWHNLSQATLPYLYYAILGILCHPLLRLGGSRRPLRATIAVSLFAGGAPGLLSALSLFLAMTLRLTVFKPFEGTLLRGLPAWAVGPFVVLTYGPALYFAITLILGLAGLHAVGRLRAFGAVLVSVVVTGVGLGILHRVAGIALGVPHFVIMIKGREILPDIWF